MTGTAFRISSGVSGRWALYCSNASWRKVPPAGSKATPICVGVFSFAIHSRRFDESVVCAKNHRVSIY